ncbi:SpoIVB peptidase S55 domain-containing protein [Edaphobacillus lindanitolerans]|uniref:SpoIVB peptidase. Serine peptidase. MEROPS family S55 n=1 Tax=Edaphobacillus lindanitolerans TaxID=550447 RepID=A0A1U7PLM8_9BACI|nr:SpoIVB peptidase S55 domain-containing protein [Edaphobacillus lindanitolerans]SIT81625.1 SpoIVB peptidase. Serine peptidase. MEROPS family S55 [Edaphobacillus lindanitolerans]
MRWISRKLLLPVLLLFLMLPSAAALAAVPKTLIPMGHSIGIHLDLGRVMVTDDVMVGSGNWLRAGDFVESLDGTQVTGTAGLIKIAGGLKDGAEAELTVERMGESVVVQADKKELENLPAFIRERTEGVGTLSYIDPQTGEYGALGHQIIDRALDGPPPFEGGSIHLAEIEQIKKSEPGAPGYKISSVEAGAKLLGDIRNNDVYGIFGKWTSSLTGAFPEPLGVMRPDEIREGDAEILTTVEGVEIGKYSIRITSTAGNAFRFTVTDTKLIKKTGGILQGMSGSPIVQDGKFAGVVTHMFVEEPTKGAGLPVEEMTKKKP